MESVAPALRAISPGEFTTARDTYTARARKAGDRQLVVTDMQVLTYATITAPAARS
ncbi:hypothetical protein ACFXJJ_00805 [Streptomyces sp. NPDC059233]